MFVVYTYIDPECEFMCGQPWGASAERVAQVIGQMPEHGGSYEVRHRTVRTWRV
jgi:hypothetical protein